MLTSRVIADSLYESTNLQRLRYEKYRFDNDGYWLDDDSQEVSPSGIVLIISPILEEICSGISGLRTVIIIGNADEH